jgi:N-acetylmuramoyl-L-alanine amidase
MKICLDFGHGGIDSGCVGVGHFLEKIFNLGCGLKLATALTERCFTVVKTRDSDRFITMHNICDFANKSGANYFVSLHANSYISGAAHGAEVYAYAPGGKGEQLARAVYKGICGKSPRLDAGRGVKMGNFQVLRNTNMPAILIEAGFLTNYNDWEYLNSSAGQAKIVQGIVAGITNFLGVK